MMSGWRWHLRLRCCAVIDPKHKLVYTRTAADRVMPDGTIEEGNKVTIWSILICKRLRWHRGECR